MKQRTGDYQPVVVLDIEEDEDDGVEVEKDRGTKVVDELCKQAKIAFKKKGIILLNLYVNPISTLLQILVSNDTAYLVQYYAAAANSSELLEAFAYPVAILIFVLFLIVVYVMYTNYESTTWLNTISWVLESFLTMTCANFIIQVFQTLFTPGTGEYLEMAWVITIGIGLGALGIWYLLEHYRHEHTAKIQLRYSLQMSPDAPITYEYLQRVRAIVHDYADQQSKQVNLDTLLKFPIDKEDSILGVLAEYHHISSLSPSKV
jgi:hypothetical protein